MSIPLTPTLSPEANGSLTETTRIQVSEESTKDRIRRRVSSVFSYDSTGVSCPVSSTGTVSVNT